SSDASVEELQNRITELNNQLSQRKRFAIGFSPMIRELVNFKKYGSNEVRRTNSIEITNLAFEPTLIIAIGRYIDEFSYSSNVMYKKNEYLVTTLTTSGDGINYLLDAMQIKYINSKIILPIIEIGSSGSEGFTWYAFE
ncbi:hypothetical protein LN557_18525, partial [Clostridioides difficile]|nr:hypothetical protein [Clostridioides difficile]